MRLVCFAGNEVLAACLGRAAGCPFDLMANIMVIPNGMDLMFNKMVKPNDFDLMAKLMVLS